MINFALPGMYEHYNILIPLCSLFKLHPEFFNDNVNISAVYGNFQFCAWDGGRIFDFNKYSHATKEEIEQLLYIYNKELKIPIRLIFTTALNDNNLCHSYFDNFVASLCQNEMNELVVSSESLEQYLRNHYPQYSFISSTTKCLNATEFKEELNKDYKYICLNYNLNKNLDMLTQVPEEKRIKLEFLINAICPPGCPSRKKHYKLNSLFSESYGKIYALGECGIIKSNSYPLNYTNNFNFDELIEYEKLGFQNFKLEGRTFRPESLILELVKYLIKPQYQFYIIEFLLRITENFNIYNYSLDKFKNVSI